MRTRFGLLLLLALLLVACSSAVERTLWVAPERVPCTPGADTADCLLVREDGATAWSPLAVPIDGFEYRDGFMYQLLIEQKTEAPDDAALALREVVSQEPAFVTTALVGPSRVPCAGDETQTCFEVQRPAGSAWETWPAEIEGLDYEEGFIYELRVAERQEPQPGGDVTAHWTVLALTDKRAAAVAGQTGGEGDSDNVAPAAETPLVFNPVSIAELNLETVVPAAWPPITDDPILANAWGLDELSFIAFNTIEGTDGTAALSGMLGVAPDALKAGDVEGTVNQQVRGGLLWHVYSQPAPVGNSVQTAAATAQAGRVYLITLFARSGEHDAILERVLSNFTLGTSVVAGGIADETVLEPNAASTVQAHAPLVDTPWTLSAIGAQPVALPEVTTARFTADGRLGGSAGCNAYTAAYTVGESQSLSVTIESFDTERCAEPAGVLLQETGFLANLLNARSYRLEGQTLSLLDEAGNVVLVFTAGSGE